jgi:hypothetical protein
VKLNNTALLCLKGISVKVAEHKKKVVQVNWNWFFNQVLDDINDKTILWNALYETQEDFFREEVKYRDMNLATVQSNKIKRYLHDILTNAIFEYSPCKDLLIGYKKKPTKAEWKDCGKKWVSLNADPFQNVSESIAKLFISYFYLTQS